MLSVFAVTGIGDEHLQSDPFANPVPGQTDTYALPSLRAAIEATNQHDGSDTIQFDPSLAGQTIVLQNGELVLMDQEGTTTIIGLGADQLTVSGNHVSRVFYMQNADADVFGLTISDGQGTDPYGGGISNMYASLSITDCVLSNNSALSRGGGISSYGTLTISGTTFSDNYGGLLGGGIYSDGTATITNCIFSRNSVDLYGGGIEASGTLTITDTTFSDNSVGNQGGGIFNNAVATIVGCTFSGNSADSVGGGICNNTGTISIEDSTFSNNSTDSYGGGICNFSTLSVVRSTFSTNSATDGGGGIDNSGNLTVSDSSFFDNTTGRYGGGIVGGANRDLAITRTTFMGNSAEEGGGGIASFGSLNLTDSTFSQNSAQQGGGIYQNGDGRVATILRTTVLHNSAEIFGGGICFYGSNTSLTITDSTISNNSASSGGGIHQGFAGILTLANIVLSGNSADSSNGGGILVTGTASIIDSLIEDNSAVGKGGGIYCSGYNYTLTIAGSTLARNWAEDGGGVSNKHGCTLTVTDCYFSENVASNLGGGIHNLGVMNLSGSVCSGNSAYSGGGLYNNGTLTVSESTFTENTADYQGGGLRSFSLINLMDSTVSDNSASTGGGIFLTAGDEVVTFLRITISNNLAEELGGGICCSGLLTITDSTISGNSAFYGGGIGQFNTQIMTVIDCRFFDNIAVNCGGGISSTGPTDIIGSTFIRNSTSTGGGGVYGIKLTISDSLFSNNTAVISGGGVAYSSGRGTTITRTTFTENSAGEGGGGIAGTAPFDLTDSIVSQNSASSGGGIYLNGSKGTITIARTTVSDNLANETSGGGICICGNDTSLTITDSTISGNSASYGGGGIYHLSLGALTLENVVLSNNSADTGDGGGLASYGPASITDSLIEENSAMRSGGGIMNSNSMDIIGSMLYGNSAAKYGGGICNRGELDIINSTLSENSADEYGGGIYNSTNRIVITGSTLARNWAMQDGGGIHSTSMVMLSNTIVAGNQCVNFPYVDISVQYSLTANHCLIQNPETHGAISGSNNLLGVDPLLGTLSDYGGPTQTIPLLPGSPAIDAGSNSFVSSDVTTDQRGFDRIVGGVVDLGAFESRGFTLSLVTGDEQQTLVGTAFVAPLAVGVVSSYGEPVVGGKVTFTAPASNARATFSPENGTAVIDDQGQAQTQAVANAIEGSYTVDAAATGSPSPVLFHLHNLEPRDVLLTETSVPENRPAGTTVGTISTDPDGGKTFSYALVGGDGDNDNAQFTISGAMLQTVAVFNHEAQSSYSIRIRSTDQDGLWREQTFTIVVIDENESPVDIIVPIDLQVAENTPAGTILIGPFDTTDPDAGDRFTYSLVAGEGSEDNAFFAVSDNMLQPNVSFDYETISSCSVRLRSTDQGGLWTEKAFVITVADVNEPPTDVLLSYATVVENQLSGVVIGRFSTIDPDISSEFTYTLWDGVDESQFSISDNMLQTRVPLNYEFKKSYSIRVIAHDQGGGYSIEKVFDISVTDVEEPPTDVVISNAVVAENQPTGTAVGTLSTADPDANNTFTYSLVSGTGSDDNTLFTISGNMLHTATVFNYEAKNGCSVRIRSTDQDGLWTEEIIAVSVTDVNESPLATVNTPSSPQSGDVTISYSLTDAESDLCNILVECSHDGGANWETATAGTGGDGITGLTSSQSGTSLTFVWDSAYDIVNANNGNVKIRITPTDTVVGTVGTTNTFTLIKYMFWRDTIGLFAPTPSTYFLQNTNGSDYANMTFNYGPANADWLPIASDWDGDGTGTIGLYNPTPSTFYLRDTNSGGNADITFAYGPANAGWSPIVGDWNNDGIDTIGLYNPTTSVFYLRNTNDGGYADVTFAYGPANVGWLPIAGDWDGDGVDTVGLYNPTTSVFYLRNTNDSGFADLAFGYGPANAGWLPIAGDWNADGTDTIGLYNPTTSVFYQRNTNDGGYANATFAYGPANAGWTPIVCDWDGPASSLLAAEGKAVVAAPDTVPLTDSALQPLVTEAIARWAAAGLSASSISILSNVKVAVADLSGAQLGLADGNTIYLDRDAAGHGWFVDPTPTLDEEYFMSANDRRLRAIDPLAVDRIDLLTVVEHELGHIAGFDDLDTLADNLMSNVLAAGVRRDP